MRWDDDLLLEKGNRERGQVQLAAYAVHLSKGHTLLNKHIKVKTIKEYVFAAASLLAGFSGHDYRYDSPTDKTFGQYLAPIYSDLERYETVPDRREPYTPEMHKEAERLAAPHLDKDSRTLFPALSNWFAKATMAGYRLTEWAQRAGNSDPRTPLLNHLLPPNIPTRALCPDDFSVETTTMQRLQGLAITTVPLTSIRKMRVRYRTQKNGHNGEERLYTLNTSPDGHCFVASAYAILQRFQALMLIDNSLTASSPLACYLDAETFTVKLITATDIEDFMRRIAANVYDLDPIKDKKSLQKWSSHSLRVGACVLLHATGFTPLDIQWLLRWRSNAFMAYLRNTAGLADRQHAAVDRASAMPHLF